MDKSLKDIEERLGSLQQPAVTETSRLRLDGLIDELAAEVVLPTQEEGNIVSEVKSEDKSLVIQKWLALVAIITVMAVFVSLSRPLEIAENDIVETSLQNSGQEKVVEPNLLFISSESIVQTVEVEESLSDDGSTLYRVQRYSVVDSDIFKDSKSGYVVTLQQERLEESRKPVTYF